MPAKTGVPTSRRLTAAAPDALTPFYLQPAGGLATARPWGGGDSYVSDPAKPVPFVPKPGPMGDRPTWTTWLVQDQRFAGTRPDGRS